MGIGSWLSGSKQGNEISREEPIGGELTSPAERRFAGDEEHRQLFRDIRESHASDGDVSEALIEVRGESYHFWGPTIAELKRENRLAEALELAIECAAAAERDPLWQHDPIEWRTPAPAWTDDSCIIARKMGNNELEIKLIERWASHLAPEHRDAIMDSSGMGKRLVKARSLLAKRTIVVEAKNSAAAS